MKVPYIWKNCWLKGMSREDAFWVEAALEEVQEKIIPHMMREEREKVLAVVHQVQGLNEFNGNKFQRYLNRESKLCFLIYQDLTYIKLMHWHYPNSQHWGMYSPFERINFEINDLVNLSN
jgi:hypothetical protein